MTSDAEKVERIKPTHKNDYFSLFPSIKTHYYLPLSLLNMSATAQTALALLTMIRADCSMPSRRVCPREVSALRELPGQVRDRGIPGVRGEAIGTVGRGGVLCIGRNAARNVLS